MQNPATQENPVINIERSRAVMLIWLSVNAALVYATYLLFSDINPWGFILMVPTVVMSFMSLWLLMNPFAVIFEDKIEFRQSFFSNSTLYFIDVKEVLDIQKGKLRIVYNDDDLDSFLLLGIRASQSELLLKNIRSCVSASLLNRPA